MFLEVAARSAERLTPVTNRILGGFGELGLRRCAGILAIDEEHGVVSEAARASRGGTDAAFLHSTKEDCFRFTRN